MVETPRNVNRFVSCGILVLIEQENGTFDMIIQIYEIQTPEEALEMVRLGVSHIGSVIQSMGKCQDRFLKNTVAVVKERGCKSSMIPLFDDTDVILSAVAFYQPDIIFIFVGLCRLRAILTCRYPSLSSNKSLSKNSFIIFSSCDPSPSAPPVPVPQFRPCDGLPYWSRSVIIS